MRIHRLCHLVSWRGNSMESCGSVRLHSGCRVIYIPAEAVDRNAFHELPTGPPGFGVLRLDAAFAFESFTAIESTDLVRRESGVQPPQSRGRCVNGQRFAVAPYEQLIEWIP